MFFGCIRYSSKSLFLQALYMIRCKCILVYINADRLLPQNCATATDITTKARLKEILRGDQSQWFLSFHSAYSIAPSIIKAYTKLEIPEVITRDHYRDTEKKCATVKVGRYKITNNISKSPVDSTCKEYIEEKDGSKCFDYCQGLCYVDVQFNSISLSGFG